MKPLKKILLFFFALIYLTHAYNRLLFTPPIFINVSVNKGTDKIEQCDGKNSSSFILARRHLPSTKQADSNKLYPVVIKTKSPDTFEYKKLTYNYFSFIISKTAEYNSHTNKAPPTLS